MTEDVDIGDFFSDDSSFYGDDETKTLYKRKVSDFRPSQFLEIQKWNLRCVSAQNRAAVHPLPLVHGVKRQLDEPTTPKKSKKLATSDRTKDTARIDTVVTPSVKPALVSRNKISDQDRGQTEQPHPKTASSSPPPVNPYAGNKMAWQLGESISAFLARLPPSTTRADQGPWIWAANPYSTSRDSTEDVAGFVRAAHKSFEQYEYHESIIRSRNTDHSGKTTRLLKPYREQLEQEIFKLAISHDVTCGKWMLFPESSSVDHVWSVVAQATVEGKLGCGAKVSTDDGGPKPERLVCVYTASFRDWEDVRRVLREMKNLGLVRDKVIYYKCDAYTYLDIKSGNGYGLKASLYSSRDMG